MTQSVQGEAFYLPSLVALNPPVTFHLIQSIDIFYKS